MRSSATSSELRVLLVDDHEVMLARMAAALSPSCTIVGVAKEGLSACDAATSLKPDVIVLDISMPGMSGLEIATRLRAAGSTAAIVFFTVHRERELVRQAMAAGGLGYVTKPRLHTDLLPAVREAVAGRSFTSPLP